MEEGHRDEVLGGVDDSERRLIGRHERDVRRGLKVFSNWSLPEGQTFHAFLQRADGNGGYALVETDSATGLLDSASKFAPWFEFQVTPVVDMTDAVAVFNAAIKCRNSIK